MVIRCCRFLRHLNDSSRCAVVTDTRWIEWFAKAVALMIACEICQFPLQQIDEPCRWLREDTPTASVKVPNYACVCTRPIPLRARGSSYLSTCSVGADDCWDEMARSPRLPGPRR